jgi:hypothetical protein
VAEQDPVEMMTRVTRKDIIVVVLSTVAMLAFMVWWNIVP